MGGTLSTAHNWYIFKCPLTVVIQKRLLDVKSAAEYLSISRSLLYQLCEKGRIRSIKINSRRLIDVNDLDEFVDKIRKEQDQY